VKFFTYGTYLRREEMEQKTVETKLVMQEETRTHLRIMSAEGGASMSGIVESLIEEEWKRSGHTAEYSSRYAGEQHYRNHAEERREAVLELRLRGLTPTEAAAALPRHLKASLGVVEKIYAEESAHDAADADATFVEGMRGEGR
jgi:hypothetical protein